MKHILSAIMLCGIVLMGACGMPDVEVEVTADKTAYTVGDVVEFNVTTTEPYDCGSWNIRKADGSSIYGETGHEASAAFTISYTTTEAGEFAFEYNAGYECDENGVPLGEFDKDIFVGQLNFSVSE